MEVEFEDRTLKRSGQNATFYSYYKAVGGPIYSSKEIAMFDLSGINQGRPNFDVLRDLIKRKYEVWLDIGMRDIQDLFDSFAMDVPRSIIGTMTAPNMSVFEEAFELSDRCVPCVQVSGGKVLRPGRKAGPTDLEGSLEGLKDIGFDTIGIIDMDRLGRRGGMSTELLARTIVDGVRTIYGGGVIETDLEQIRMSGAKGAFMYPFTPMIANLLGSGDNTVPMPSPTAHEIPVVERAPSGRPQWTIE